MIVSIYLEEHEYLVSEPQTLNFGGKYLYSFLSVGNYLIVKRKLNEKYIPDFYNISDIGSIPKENEPDNKTIKLTEFWYD